MHVFLPMAVIFVLIDVQMHKNGNRLSKAGSIKRLPFNDTTFDSYSAFLYSISELEKPWISLEKYKILHDRFQFFNFITAFGSW